MVAIIDYGVGNLFSLRSSFAAIGEQAEVTGDAARIAQADRVILPGVGAFADAYDKLCESGMDEAVRRAVKSGKPVMGICLGMQLLFARSEEGGDFEGLGLIPSAITRFPERGLKVPHMGWNNLRLRPCPLFDGLEGEPYVYFVHSYHAAEVNDAWTAATCDYGAPFTAAVWRGNVLGTQFHPEKSGAAGLRMLQNFAALKGGA